MVFHHLFQKLSTISSETLAHIQKSPCPLDRSSTPPVCMKVHKIQTSCILLYKYPSRFVWDLCCPVSKTHRNVVVMGVDSSFSYDPFGRNKFKFHFQKKSFLQLHCKLQPCNIYSMAALVQHRGWMVILYTLHVVFIPSLFFQ